MQHHKKYHFVIIGFIAALSGVLFGYDTGVISGAILFIKDTLHLNPEHVEVLVSAVLIGAFLGALISGRLADRFGRKRLLIFDAIIFILGTWLTAETSNYDILIFGRIVVGFAIGIASYIAPLYISEISPTKYRGAMVSLNQLAITIGITISYIIDYYFSHTADWRAMLAFGVVPAALLLAGMLFLPYSPRWLFAKGKTEEAFRILSRIRASKEHTQAEFNELSKMEHQERKGFKELFSKTVRPTLLIAGGLAFLQQVTGVNTILYYAPTIFKLSGYHSSTAAILATLGVGIVFVLLTIVALPLIDKLGRKILIYVGVGVMAVSMALLSLAFHQLVQHTSFSLVSPNHIALVSMLLYIGGFAISLGPITWLIIAEIFPLNIRGSGSSLASSINWASNWLVSITFLSLISSLGESITFLIYCALCILTLLFTYNFVPETKGVSLETIEKNLYQGKPARELGDQ